MHKKQTNRLLATVLSIVMILSLVVIPAGAATPMGDAAVAETPAEAPASAGLSSARPAANDAPAALLAAADPLEIDVWDFGAEQLADTAAYKFNNHLNVEVINGWYEGMVDKEGKPVTVKTGQEGNNFPHTGFTDEAGLSYRTGTADNPAYNHRLRTDNTALTRDSGDTCTGDGNDPYVSAVDAEGKPTGATYHGILYSNSAANPEVHFALECESGDIVTLIVSSNGTNSLINFSNVVEKTGENNAVTYEKTVEASDVFTRGSRTKMQTMTFHAKETGTYWINSVNEKLVVARIYRQHATPVAVSGAITEAEGMPAGYSLVFTNTTTGAEIVAPVADATYSTTLLAPYTYDVSLKDANGFAVLVGAEVSVDVTDANVKHRVITQAVDRVTVSGAISGLDDDAKAKLVGNLLFTPTGDGIVYVPEVTIQGDTYTVAVEKDMPVTISAKKLNDWEITTQNITDRVFTEDTTLDLAFAKKATYPVTITTTGMTAEELATTKITFTNLHEAGETEDQVAVPFDPYGPDNLTGSIYNYSYTFTGTEGITLRDGVYDVTVDDPHQKVTANLTVNGAAATLTIPFNTPAPYVANGLHDFTPANSSLAKVDGISGPFTYHGDHGLTGTGDMTISLGELSTITIAGCRYSQVNGTLLVPTAKANGETVEVVATKEGEANKTDPEYVISNVEGEVVVTFPEGSSYIHSIKVEPAVTPTIAGEKFTFAGANSTDEQKAYIASIDGLAFSKINPNTGHGPEWTNGSTLTLELADTATVIITTCRYNGSNNKIYIGTDATGEEVTSITEIEENEPDNPGTAKVYTLTDVPAGTLTLYADQKAYVHSIEVQYAEETYYGTDWDFRNDGVGQGTAYYPKDDTEGKTFADKDGLGAMVVAGGKFQGHDTTYGTAGNGYTMTVPVMTACTVKARVGYNWWVWADGTNVTSDFTEAAPATHSNKGTTNNDGTFVTFTYTGTEPGEVVIHVCAARAADPEKNLEKIGDSYVGQVLVEYGSDVELPKPPVVEDIVYTVGTDKEFQTINDALAAAAQAKRAPGQRITIEIDPGNYEEQLYIKVKDLTLKNASETPSIKLKNKGVDIDENAVRITWYYGHGYTYYSMTNGHRYDADVLAANKANGYASYINKGAGSTDDSYWNASVLVAADGLRAEGIIFENSFNQYISAKSLEDVIEPQGAQAKEGNVARASMKTVGDTKVQEKAYVERAGALSIKSGTNIVFDNCAFISHQDTFYGPEGSKVACYGCDIYGGTDYIYGGMTLVAAKCNLLFNTSEDNNDVGYITAAQQKSSTEPGYLFWNCTIDSTEPGVNTAAKYRSKPGYFGRPWESTGQALFYATDIKATDPVYFGVSLDKESTNSTSLITPAGWNNSLGGTSARSQEMGTVEYYKDVDNASKRVSWATAVTTAPTVADFFGDWDPFEGKDMTIANQTPVDAPDATVPVTKLTMGQKAQEMKVGDTLQLTVTVEPANATDKTLDWTSSDLSVVTVDENGKVTAVGGGTAKVKASTKNHMVNVEVMLTVIIPVDSVTLNKTTINMGAGRSTKLLATVEPENASNQKVTFTSSDETVVTVDANGKVTAKGAGTATITATSEDGGKTATCAVTITGALPTVPTDPEVDAALADLIAEVKAEAASVEVSDDGTDVSTKNLWVTQDDMDAIEAAIAAAEAVADDEFASIAEKQEAITALTAAKETFVDAQQEGTRKSRPAGALPGGTTTTATIKETVENDKGDVATIVTVPGGDKTITVVNADGETVAEIKLPATIAAPAKGFVDVPDDHWAAGAINEMAGLGMVKGINEEGTIFDMNSSMTRGSIATMFYRLSNGSEGIASTFADVAEGDWYADAIGWAAKTGVVTGYDETTFGPDDTITREQLAVMLCRFANLIGLDTKANAVTLEAFSDGAAASDWAVSSLAWAVKNGVMKGRGDDTLDPTTNVTRAEATVMFDRVIALMK